MDKVKITGVSLVMVVFLLTACAAPVAVATPVPPTLNTSEQPTAPTSVPNTVVPVATVVQPTATAAPPTAAPASLIVTDSVKRQVKINGIPKRIISLAPSTTEIVFALGAGDRVVGVDQFSDYPEAAKKIAKISDGFNPNYEQIVADKPDLVLAAGITSADAIKKLQDLDLTVLVIGTETTTFETVKVEIKLVGQVLGLDDQALAVTDMMDKKVADVKAHIAKAKTKPKVYWELDATDPGKPFAPGPGTFVNDLIVLAGGESVTASAKQAYAQFNAEEIIKANPEIIILSDAAYGVAPESIGKRPGWNIISAVKNNKVFPIDDNLVSRPGPRLADGLEAAAKLIHPEVLQSGAATTVNPATYTDPFAYCAAVGTLDVPDARYIGAIMPETIAKGLQKAFGVSSSAPLDPFITNSIWRCMGGQVFACNFGANLPCDSKAETEKAPTQGESDFCKANPNSEFIPAVVTGHATVYEWRCNAGAPGIVKQLVQPDAQAYLSNIWYAINPN